MDTRTTPSGLADALGARWLRSRHGTHIVDQLIDERSVNIARNPLWPVVRWLALRHLYYRQAVEMVDHASTLPGRQVMDFVSETLALDVRARGVENIPAEGGFVLAPTHPTGIADGVAVYDIIMKQRPDALFFGNRDAVRVAPGLAELIIPVEWRKAEKTHAKSRDTLAATARAFAAGRPLVMFPSGRIAFWHEGKLTERPWQTSVVTLARRYGYPIVPTHIAARNSGLFYLISRYSTDLRDMTLFRELLNKKGRRFDVTFGRPIDPERLAGDPAEVTRRLQHHSVEVLAENPQADFKS